MLPVKDILKILTDVVFLPGQEASVMNLVSSLIPNSFFCSCDEDHNIIIKSRNYDKGGLLIEAHYDTVGLIITERVSDTNLYKCKRYGLTAPWDWRNQLVNVHLQNGKTAQGLLLSPPPHFFINKKYEDYHSPLVVSVENSPGDVHSGDLVTYQNRSFFLENKIIVSPYLDNNSSISAIITLLNHLSIAEQAKVAICLSAKEEISQSSFKYVMGNTRPSAVLSLDTCFSSDMYGIPSELNRESKVGNGLMLLDDDRMSSSLFNKMVCICKNETIDYHLYYHPWMEKKGTNAYSIANNYPGLPVGSVLLPCSAMHTPLEMMSLQDIEQEEHLLYSFIVSMKL